MALIVQKYGGTSVGVANRLRSVAARVVETRRRGHDVIVVVSTRTALAAQRATSDIPVVFAGVLDPVSARLVTSLARPGGNLTGSAMGVGGDFAGKWVELLKEAVPTLSHAVTNALLGAWVVYSGSWQFW